MKKKPPISATPTQTARLLGISLAELKALPDSVVFKLSPRCYDLEQTVPAFIRWRFNRGGELKPEDLPGLTAGLHVMAALFDVEPRRITQLGQSGVMEKGGHGVYKVHASTVNYTAFLRDSAQGKKKPPVEHPETGEELNESAERAMYYRASTREKELKNAKEEGRLVDIDDVRHFQLQLQSVRNSIAESIAGRLCSELARLTDAGEVRQRLQKEMRKLRAAEAEEYLKLADG